MKSRVAVLRVTPDRILSDIDRLVDLAGVSSALAAGKTTILKDNISWHFPFPAANTTPWQLEGTIQALARRGFADQVCVQNKTVVTNAFKGEDLNHYVPIFKRYQVPVLYNFKDEDMTWVRYEPKARMRVLNRIFPEGIHVPDFFFGKNIVHLPTTKCHIYTTTTGAMKNAFGGLLNTRRHYTHSWIHETLVDLLAIQKEIHSGSLRDHGRHDGGQRARAAHDVPGRQERDAGVGRPGRDRRGVGEDDGVRSDVARLHPRSRTRTASASATRATSRSSATSTRRNENWQFHVGKNLVRIGGGDLIWFGPLKRFQKLFFHTPLVNGFILASDVYHDFYRWPLRRPARVRALVRDHGVGPDVPALRADGAAGPPLAGVHRAETTVPASSRIH